MQGLQQWYRSDAPDDVVVIDVLTQNNYGYATPSDARQWEDANGLSFPVLADEEGDWMRVWGANGGTSQHAYTVIDSKGRVHWRRADGSGGSVSLLTNAIEDAP